eukprot:SAG22_NODE_566_length_9044_cov_4.581107_7_plen_441_part_00
MQRVTTYLGMTKTEASQHQPPPSMKTKTPPKTPEKPPTSEKLRPVSPVFTPSSSPLRRFNDGQSDDDSDDGDGLLRLPPSHISGFLKEQQQVLLLQQQQKAEAEAARSEAAREQALADAREQQARDEFKQLQKTNQLLKVEREQASQAKWRNSLATNMKELQESAEKEALEKAAAAAAAAAAAQTREQEQRAAESNGRVFIDTTPPAPALLVRVEAERELFEATAASAAETIETEKIRSRQLKRQQEQELQRKINAERTAAAARKAAKDAAVKTAQAIESRRLQKAESKIHKEVKRRIGRPADACRVLAVSAVRSDGISGGQLVTQQQERQEEESEKNEGVGGDNAAAGLDIEACRTIHKNLRKHRGNSKGGLQAMHNATRKQLAFNASRKHHGSKPDEDDGIGAGGGGRAGMAKASVREAKIETKAAFRAKMDQKFARH